VLTSCANPCPFEAVEQSDDLELFCLYTELVDRLSDVSNIDHFLQRRVGSVDTAISSMTGGDACSKEQRRAN
jgi:hypothetical protein